MWIGGPDGSRERPTPPADLDSTQTNLEIRRRGRGITARLGAPTLRGVARGDAASWTGCHLSDRPGHASQFPAATGASSARLVSWCHRGAGASPASLVHSVPGVEPDPHRRDPAGVDQPPDADPFAQLVVVYLLNGETGRLLGV